MRGIFLPEKRPEIFRALLYNRNGRAYLNSFEKRHAGRAGHADAPMGLRRLENRAYVHPNSAVRQPHEVRHGGIIQIGNMMHCLFRNAEMAHGRAVGSLTHSNGKIHGYLIPHHQLAPLATAADHHARIARGSLFHDIGIHPFVVHLRIINSCYNHPRVRSVGGHGYGCRHGQGHHAQILFLRAGTGSQRQRSRYD